MTLDFDINIDCDACGATLEATWIGYYKRIEVKPCKNCLEEEKDKVAEEKDDQIDELKGEIKALQEQIEKLQGR